MPVAVGAGNSRNPVVRSFGDALFCAWIEADADGYEIVWAGWWELDGRPRSAPVRLGAAGETTWNLNAAIARLRRGVGGVRRAKPGHASKSCSLRRSSTAAPRSRA